VNIVMHSSTSEVNVNPSHETVLRPDDSMLVIAPIDRLIELERANKRAAGPAEASEGPTALTR
jgi:hypothetical protein